MELLRIITMYPGLSGRQLCRFYPGKEDTVNQLLSHFIRQGRIRYEDTCHGYFPALTSTAKDKELTDAVWVLLDFLERIEFHSVSDYPVKLIFFAGGESYEVISIPVGREALITHILKQQKDPFGKRILIVETPKQIAALDIPFVSGYCTVTPDGKVDYYKKQ